MAVGSIGLLHPGEMGARIGAVLVQAGHRVNWASAGRSPASRQRAQESGLVDVGSVEVMAAVCDLIISVCPPHAALAVAGHLPPFKGIYLDANAISPATARQVAQVIEPRGGHYLDGSIIGPPPTKERATRLYLAGASGAEVADIFSGTTVEALVISDGTVAASALKMSYAAWSKGSAALLLAVRALAGAEGVLDPLLAAWQASEPELVPRSLRAGEQAATKGWRWVGEMEEVAATFRSAGLPDGFHRAAAEVFDRAAAEAGSPRERAAPPMLSEASPER